MRAFVRLAIAASTIGGVAMDVAVVSRTFAQAKPPAADSGEDQPKQVALTQKQIDGVLSAQKEIRAIEDKDPQAGADKPDPKVEAQLDAAAKKNGFSGLGEYADVSSSIGIVMAGMDPQTKKYVGPETIVKKQIAEVKADKSMPPKEKKEALEELSAALHPSISMQPLPGNIDLVGKNFDKLSESMQGDAD